MGIERVMESETMKEEKRKMKREEERVVSGDRLVLMFLFY